MIEAFAGDFLFCGRALRLFLFGCRNRSLNLFVFLAAMARSPIEASQTVENGAADLVFISAGHVFNLTACRGS